MNAPYPLLLAPLLLPRVWGGCDLTPTTSPKSESLTGHDPAPIGEAWEVHDGVTVRNGRHVGSTLGALLHEDAATLLGPDVDASAGFPLLIKRLSVAAWLSLQVHPDDAQAARFENAPRGKEEAWVILAPKDGEAEFILGMREGVTTADLAAASATPTRWDGLLRRVRARAGAVLHVPPGTVHAIGPGVTLYEVQQNCDITYRFYDWGRLGLDGRPRALQPKRALQVTRLDHRPVPRYPTSEEAILLETAHFRTQRHRIRGERRLDTGGRRCHALTCIAGELRVESAAEAVTLRAGESALIPAALGEYDLYGQGVALRTEQP